METNVGIPVDGRLQSMVEAAERGETCPDIYVLVGSWVIQGVPISTAEFLKLTHSDYYSQVAETREARKLSRDPAERERVINEHLAPYMSTFGASTDQDAAALSIRNPAISGSSGPIIHTPAMRVPLSAVQGWWSAKFTVDQNRRYSGGVGFGFSF